MAASLKTSKRKIDTDSVRNTKKAKNTKEAPVPNDAVEQKATTKNITKAVNEPVVTQSGSNGTRKSTRKRAADFFETEQVLVAPVTAPASKKVRTVKPEGATKEKKTVKKTDQEEIVTLKLESKVTRKDTTKPKKGESKPATVESKPKREGLKTVKTELKSQEEEPKPSKSESKPKKSLAKLKKESKISEPVEVPFDEDNEGDEVDDQTAELLKGFESSEDEEEIVVDEPAAIDNVPAAPSSKALQKRLKAAGDHVEERGVIYVGRIPHGFYEHQMRAYFSQFGDITRLRLSRNKKTGQSKHYAFVEFASSEVAKIVANTMDKYLMFNHILQVRTVPKEQVHKNLFAGANSRFKAVPRNKLAAKHLRQPLHKEGWERRITKEVKRRSVKAAQLKEIGYEFKAPAIKSV
ncbi:hypothetical protein EJ05DRAFT_302998 [Pseudovirgaria hyperparasitica]|uniref:RRM domain-containing protein n=1 Tax=Pseudovirgaria hyperparasitica TaxID=470096 RepID=A0A6A6WC26_9PEZI|nr:uncharacterized protein EJ05DRAFT_302998 [Pseudovirgaria hyperparasitica]KAF2759594.1 hypothetical protein EJ05DRAFT_302998 [Pseudovirgaria hyperparasitica]